MVATKTCFTVVDLFKPSYVKIHVMPKMARNRSALHDVLAQGVFNRDITVIKRLDDEWCQWNRKSMYTLPCGAKLLTIIELI